MKNPLSILACFIICIALVFFRISNSDLTTGHKPLKITEWDAFGYYMYLPAFCIYEDHKQLNWLDTIDKKYGVTGGNGWQALKQDNGNYVFKYLGGVALLQLPFFAAGHFVAQHSQYPPDGFSPPYQYVLGFGIIFYSLMALLLLRKILLRYYDDRVTAITLLLLCLASNYIQYAAVDSGQSHAYLFVLYAAILYTTIRWHEKPSLLFATLTGYVIGLATMTRPTEAIMLFIPLMWNTHTREAAAAKWAMVKNNRSHLIGAMAGGVLGILPQLLYWKNTTGSFLFDVGSKWDFLNPHFRVLFGWEKGWFIYTPVTLLFVAGMFFIKKFPFRKSVLWFCLLNIYIIIGWHEWRYGGSYSTRALVQSYAVFALPLAAATDKLMQQRFRALLLATGLYLIAVNFFQIGQYNATILHYDDMNRRYYVAIYLNPHPTPADMGLLDNDEIVKNESGYKSTVLFGHDSVQEVSFSAGGSGAIAEVPLHQIPYEETIVKVEASVMAPGHLWQSYLHTELTMKDSVKRNRVRLFSPISKDTATNSYTSYMKIPIKADNGTIKVFISSSSDFKGTVQSVRVTLLQQQH
ncbi:MAG: hypothetical protein JNM41_00935 [Flavipsychrobacter sp.]|nr:hypothetical protein [Flavipsychrobacter sp.]